MNFVAIDFETANEKRGSPCAMAVAVVRDGALTESKTWLIRPKLFWFNPYNVFIHGISEEMVTDKPELPELWPEIHSFLEGNFVIAHNASFDMSVLRHTLDQYKMPYPEFEYSCTHIIAKNTWPGRASYALQIVANHLGIEFKHHDVTDDARACAEVACHACTELGIESMHELEEKLEMRHGQMFRDSYRPARSSRWSHRSTTAKTAEIKPTTDEFDPDHPLNGRVVVFTGALKSMQRKDAMQIAVDAGAQCGNGVTRETNFLVVGDLDFRTLAAGQTKSRKLQKAEELAYIGQDIEIISEDDFLRMSSQLSGGIETEPQKHLAGENKMPGKKVSMILRSKTDLSDEEIARLSDAEGWKLIYSLKPSNRKTEKQRHEILFTGFSPSDKIRLKQLALDKNLHVVKTVTKSLDFLVTGSNAGPFKLKKAKQQNVVIMSEEEFYSFLKTGEIPS